MPDSKFLEYFVAQTEKNFNELKAEVHSMNTKLNDLIVVKAQMINDAKWRAYIISGVIGLISIGVNFWISVPKG